MSSAVSLRRSPDEYIAFERTQEVRSEYDDGVLRAMSGASHEHNLVAGNLFATMHSQLRRGPCTVYINDMRVAVELGRFYTYPDLVIVCGGPQFLDNQSDTLLNPTVLFEVLSPSTETYDRGRKFVRYQSIACSENTLPEACVLARIFMGSGALLKTMMIRCERSSAFRKTNRASSVTNVKATADGPWPMNSRRLTTRSGFRRST